MLDHTRRLRHGVSDFNRADSALDAGFGHAFRLVVTFRANHRDQTGRDHFSQDFELHNFHIVSRIPNFGGASVF